MSVFLNEVNPCLPPHYAAMDLFAEVFEDELVPTIESKWRRDERKGDSIGSDRIGLERIG